MATAVIGLPMIALFPVDGFDLSNLKQKDVEDILIQVYVPNAEEIGMSREDALAVAMEKDLERARQLVDDVLGAPSQIRIPARMPTEEIELLIIS